jgi:hypothetical protein
MGVVNLIGLSVGEPSDRVDAVFQEAHRAAGGAAEAPPFAGSQCENRGEQLEDHDEAYGKKEAGLKDR